MKRKPRKSRHPQTTLTSKRLAMLLVIGLSILTSCNVTRTIKTESSSVQKGDTSVIIQTKTIESYNAKKVM